MDQTRSLAEQFEGARPHLRAVAFRILGTADDADECFSATDVCSGFLTRPFAPQELLARVADQLSAPRANRAADRAVCA